LGIESIRKGGEHHDYSTACHRAIQNEGSKTP